MKTNLCIILVGAGASDEYSGQYSDLQFLIENNVTIISTDPQHSKESRYSIEEKCGVPTCLCKTVNDLNQKYLNLFFLTSENFFKYFEYNNNTYYVILSFTGINMEYPSWEIARLLGVKNKSFYNIENAIFLAMGCLCSPPNIIDLLIHLSINPFHEFEEKFISHKLNYLIKLQEIYYAFQNNIDGLYRAHLNNTVPEWCEMSLKKLKKIGINSISDAHDKYKSIENIIGITNMKQYYVSKLIKNELSEIDLLRFWNERKNNFQILHKLNS